ncbi:MAG: hypothetical protein AAGC46_12430 [Solirubrobacteraceae bacterium]|nr:hypothetical protein [Patulibacter sp.]
MSLLLTRTRGVTAAGIAAAAVGAIAFTSTSSADQAPPTSVPNPNTYQCHGNLYKGAKADPIAGGHTVHYAFQCPGPITGYQIQTQTAINTFDSDSSVQLVNGASITTDSFSCNGDTPGIAFNCVGISSVPNAVISGNFTVDNPIYQEPRPDALLTVTYATADTKGKVITQYISGPFDLGRPKGGPKSKYSGSTRIPPVNKAEDAQIKRDPGTIKSKKSSKKKTSSSSDDTTAATTPAATTPAAK